jgi:cytochrome c biogenesis protein CcdA
MERKPKFSRLKKVSRRGDLKPGTPVNSWAILGACAFTFTMIAYGVLVSATWLGPENVAGIMYIAGIIIILIGGYKVLLRP